MIPALAGPVRDVTTLVLPPSGTALRDSDAAQWKTRDRGRTGLVDIVDGAGHAVAQCVHPAHAPLLLAAAAEAVALRARVAALEATLAARDARQLTLDVEGGR